MIPLITSAVDTVLGIIDKVVPDKQKAAEMKLQTLQMQQSGELKELEVRMSAIIAEAQSQDKWTSRARPSFMYVVYIMILAAIPMGIVYAISPTVATEITHGVQAWLASIPRGMWDAFAIGYTGYSAARSYDKKHINNKRWG